MRMRHSSWTIPILLGALAACTESASLEDSSVMTVTTSSTATAPSELPAEPRPGQRVRLTRAQAVGTDAEYRFRLVGGEEGPTSLFLVIGRGASESEYFVDRCDEFDTDEFLPEGLLMPVVCDGRRIVLVEENGQFVVRGGRRTVKVPVSS